MTEYYAFLYLLSRHKKYYLHQDRIFLHLKANKARIFFELIAFVKDLDPLLLEQLLSNELFQTLKMSSGENHFCAYGEELYPLEFYLLTDPPLVFSYRGKPCWLHSLKLTVVGSRNPTLKSLQWMSLELPKLLARNSWVTVSGGAIGVDLYFHQLSLKSQCPTIVILPSGINKVYPLAIKSKEEEIVKQGGCFLSEFMPHEEVKKYHFQHRNRLIAALNQFCLVIEAKEKSGSLITGHFVLELGKDLMVLPGHPMDLNFHGSHHLLKLGGIVFTSHIDLDTLF